MDTGYSQKNSKLEPQIISLTPYRPFLFLNLYPIFFFFFALLAFESNELSASLPKSLSSVSTLALFLYYRDSIPCVLRLVFLL